MTADIAAGSAQFEIGRVIRRMFYVIRKNLVSFALLSLIFLLPGFIFVFWSLLAAYLHIPIRTWLPSDYATAALVNSIGGFVISFVFQRLLEASVAHGVMASMKGSKSSFAECLVTGLKNALPLAAIALIGLVAIIVGLAVLIVPGIVLALMFSVAAPVRVMEHTGIAETLNRSTQLTHGHRAQIFALLVIYYVITLAIGFSVRPLAGLPYLGTGGTRNSVLVFMILSGVVRTFLGLLLAGGVASIYYELRLVKEGYEPEQLAAVFA